MEEDTAERKSEEDSKEEREKLESKEELESRIKSMERRIKELEKGLGEKRESEYHEESYVGDIVSSLIPGFGKIVKTLEKASPEFRQRIAETDEEIKHRLETGWSDRKPTVSYGLSIRPLSTGPTGSTRASTRRMPEKKNIEEVKIESARIEPVFDVFEEEDHIFVIAEIPDAGEEDIRIELEGGKLNISAGMYGKTIILPSEAEAVKEKSFSNGVLQLKIKKKEKADQA
jgi:HSP20 family protein